MQNQQRGKAPQESYQVFWISKGNDHIFSKNFPDQRDAIDFSKSNKFSIVLRMKKGNNDAVQWEIVPTLSAREFVKNVKARKFLEKKNKFFNADGISETQITTTAALKTSQNVRLFQMAVFTPVLIYAGMQKDIPVWLKYSLWTIAGLNLISNYSNYSANKKLLADSLNEEEEEA